MRFIYPPHYFRITPGQLLEPHQQESDQRRKEYILNVLLVGLIGAAVIALADSGIDFWSQSIPHYRNSFIVTLLFSGFAISLPYTSRRGHYKLASNVFIFLLALVAAKLTLQWGFMLPQVQLLYAMIIVIASVLLSARAKLVFMSIAMVLIPTVGYLQIHGSLQPNTDWLSKPFYEGDAIGYIIVLMIIGLVSWLSNREIDRSLCRARESEAALDRERANLEIKVNERTQQLEETQLLHLMELRRFAEFGRLSANLLHEVANPLTAASLSLQLIDDRRDPGLVWQARKNLKHLERYVESARKQLKGQGEITTFCVRSELNQVLRSLQPRARQAKVKVNLNLTATHTLTGDAVKFSQLTANLIANAIDAYARAEPSGSRPVEITISRNGAWLRCSVVDWGEGIPAAALSKIFEPFYTTKPDQHQNLGIGLALVKQFAEEDFHGTIKVTSSPTNGTRFSLNLKDQNL